MCLCIMEIIVVISKPLSLIHNMSSLLNEQAGCVGNDFRKK